MRASKIFKKENGDKYKVELSLIVDWSKQYWVLTLYHCPKGKRKMVVVNCDDDIDYKRLGPKGRNEYYQKFISSIVPDEWIEEVKQLLISELNKPIEYY